MNRGDTENIFREMNMEYPTTPKDSVYKSTSSTPYNLDDESINLKLNNNHTRKSSSNDYLEYEEDREDTISPIKNKYTSPKKPISSPSKNYKYQVQELRSSPIKKNVKIDQPQIPKLDSRYVNLSSKYESLKNKYDALNDQNLNLMEKIQELENNLKSQKQKHIKEVRGLIKKHEDEKKLIQGKLLKYYTLHERCQTEHGKFKEIPKEKVKDGSLSEELVNLMRQYIDRKKEKQEPVKEETVDKEISQDYDLSKQADKFIKLCIQKLEDNVIPTTNNSPIREQSIQRPSSAPPQTSSSGSSTIPQLQPITTTSEESDNPFITRQQLEEFKQELKEMKQSKSKKEDKLKHEYVSKEDFAKLKEELLNKDQPIAQSTTTSEAIKSSPNTFKQQSPNEDICITCKMKIKPKKTSPKKSMDPSMCLNCLITKDYTLSSSTGEV
ncbi:unnamed protein product [Candida verbasci]|uniref:Uncharacterized protein n=1 Tax=Candida verbasci TaxID=1227364 RepID=A0A9W4X941_9ASCO|nr:unnamed protein product [Candida verbasci]